MANSLESVVKRSVPNVFLLWPYRDDFKKGRHPPLTNVGK